MIKQPKMTNPKPTVARFFQSINDDRGMLNLNVHMFTEDVRLAVMPIGGRSRNRNEFSITLKGSEGECIRAQKLIGNIAQYDRQNLKSSVCDAVEEIAKRLSWEGRAVYEIIQSEDEVPNLFGFTSKNLIRLLWWFIQIIPKGDWQLWEKKLVIVPSGRIWRIEIPKALGGRRGYLGIINRLKRFDLIGPEHWRSDMERGNSSSAFDFIKYRRVSDIYRTQITRTWGWNRRDLSQDRTTEFYYFYKKVTFRWAQAILREHIINELNNLLCRLGIECVLIVNGLPTPKDILKIRSDLLAGELSFTSASDKTSLS